MDGSFEQEYTKNRLLSEKSGFFGQTFVTIKLAFTARCPKDVDGVDQMKIHYPENFHRNPNKD
jgi:hypothetical protein